MRILYFHQYFNTPSMSGGTRSYEMAIRMIKKGHEVHIITSDREGSPNMGKWEEEIIEEGHISKDILEEITGKPVNKYAFPGGGVRFKML